MHTHDHFHIWWAKLNPHICQSWLSDWATVLLDNHITNTPWPPHFPAPRESNTDLIFTPHRVPVALHILCPHITRVWYRSVCISQLYFIQSSGGLRGCFYYGHLGGVGVCVGYEVGSMECIKSHVNKCQLESQWNSWGERSRPCRSVGCVNIVSTVADWGEEEMEPSLWAATRIILVKESTQNQFQHAFTLYNHSCLTASTLANNACQGKHAVNHDLWTNLNT